MRNVLLFVASLFAATLCLGAEVYPAKSVRVVVPFAPGGATDFTARVISQQLSEQLGKQFVVDNRTGASGVIGNTIVAKAAPDGYTISMADPSFAVVPSLKKSLPYDPLKSFTPISQISRSPQVLVVANALKTNTLREFVAAAQSNPGKFNYGASGAGTASQLASELFKRAAKVDIAEIQYKGNGEVITALLAGQVQMLLTTAPAVSAHIKSGRVRALAVTTEGSKRMPSMPDVPSMAEAGVSGMVVYVWFGLVGPAGIPKAIVDRLHAEVAKAVADPSMKERFVTQDAELVGSAPEEFSKMIRGEVQRWAEIIKAAGISAE